MDVLPFLKLNRYAFVHTWASTIILTEDIFEKKYFSKNSVKSPFSFINHYCVIDFTKNFQVSANLPKSISRKIREAKKSIEFYGLVIFYGNERLFYSIYIHVPLNAEVCILVCFY